MTSKLEDNLRRGTLDLLVLRIVSQGSANGVEVCRYLREVSQYFPEPTHGSIYPCLRRLEGRKWVACWAGLTKHRRVGHYYWITDAGRAALAEQTACWRSHRDAVERVLERDRWQPK